MSQENFLNKIEVERLVREGDYLAEVDVTLIETDHEWSPYLSAAGARKTRGRLKSGNWSEVP